MDTLGCFCCWAVHFLVYSASVCNEQSWLQFLSFSLSGVLHLLFHRLINHLLPPAICRPCSLMTLEKHHCAVHTVDSMSEHTITHSSGSRLLGQFWKEWQSPVSHDMSALKVVSHKLMFCIQAWWNYKIFCFVKGLKIIKRSENLVSYYMPALKMVSHNHMTMTYDYAYSQWNIFYYGMF